MKHFIIALLILLNTIPSSSQVADSAPKLALMARSGLLFPGATRWHFAGDVASTQTKPEILGGVGVQYGPVVTVEGVILIPSLELAFGELGTADHQILSGTAAMTIQRLPVMLWCTLEAESPLSPFVRIGSGVCMTDIQETYTSTFYPSSRFHRWNFVWGYGTGLRYRFSSAFALSIFVDNWVTDASVTAENSWGSEIGLTGPYADTPAGLSLTISF